MGLARHVRHLRLATPSEAALRQVLPRLEDALRCASLPDGDGRVLLVRRLALGALDRHATSHSLAQRIEQRVAQAGIEAVAGGTPAAAAAGVVGFASALQARTSLGLRLARREPCSEWYWPLAVPEFHAAAGVAANLRAIAVAIADWPEAAAAVPAWAAAIVQGGGEAVLTAAIDPFTGDALLRRIGVAPAAATVHAPPETEHAAPPWLLALLASAPAAIVAARGAAPRFDAPAPPAKRRDGEVAEAPVAGSAAPHSAERPPSAPPAAEGHERAPGAAAASQPDVVDGARFTSPHTAAISSTVTEPHTDPTAAGGLLFLLPLLQRLGLPPHCDGAEPAWTADFLAATLHRLRVPADDPAWSLTSFPPWGKAGMGARAAPPPHAALATVRHWLRRHGRIGLASLVLRPARLALTATHADIHFTLDQTDLRVRRLGLDIDPGWLPWFGRVVSFHYHRDPHRAP